MSLDASAAVPSDRYPLDLFGSALASIWRAVLDDAPQVWAEVLATPHPDAFDWDFEAETARRLAKRHPISEEAAAAAPEVLGLLDAE